MAKSAFPMKTGGGLLPKVIGWLLAIGALVLVVQHPTESAECVKATFAGFETFVTTVAG